MLSKIKQFFEEQISPLVEGDSQHHEKGLQEATVILLLEMMRADGHVSQDEERVIEKLVAGHFVLTQEETLTLIAFARDELDQSACLQSFTRLLNENLSQNDKIRIIELLWQIAYADGQIDKYEEHYLRRIADLLYVPHSAFVRMKHQVQEEFAKP